MCIHCERLVEDADQKDLVHRFMAATAERVNRKLQEEGKAYRITANHISLTINVELPEMPGIGGVDSRRVYRLLAEMHK